MRDRERRQSTDDFPQQLVEMLTWLSGQFPPSHPFSRIKLTPAMPGSPEVWLLGSSLWSAAAAAHLGLPYAFAHFIDSNPTRSAFQIICRTLRPRIRRARRALSSQSELFARKRMPKRRA